MGDPHKGVKGRKRSEDQQLHNRIPAGKNKRKGSKFDKRLAEEVAEAKWRRLKAEKRASRSTELSLFLAIVEISPVNSPGI